MESEQKASRALREDCERMVEETKSRYEREMAELRQRLAIEKESWEDMYMRKQQSMLLQKVPAAC